MLLVFGLIAGLLIGAVLAFVLGKKASPDGRSVESEAKELIAAASAQAEQIKKAAEVEGKELGQRLKTQAEEDMRTRKQELTKREESVLQKEKQVEKRQIEAKKKADELQQKVTNIETREKQAETAASKAEEQQKAAKAKLEEIAKLSAAEARDRLVQEMMAEAQAQAAIEIKKIEDAAQTEADDKAKTIIAAAVQRYASEFVAERTVSIVPLPSDDMKGRLIGREGRNIRALEAAAGIDLIVDDTSEIITVSCFNPVRREIARIAISKLVSDGRIHPTRIEEVVTAAEKEVENVCKEAGEQAVFDLGLHKLHPDLVRMLGQLKYRSTSAQNVLQHSVEVGYLAGLMAAELGQNVKLAKRAGLLHDIGKAVDHEQEGSHSEVGAAVAKKFGEHARICQAIASHHGEVKPQSILDHIVDAANQLSSARPGARRETLAAYVKRLVDLEALAARMTGVTKAYALQSGREIRVMVENDKVSDAQARVLSKDLAKKIEQEATYPGQVRVVVVRETRASEYAR